MLSHDVFYLRVSYIRKKNRQSKNTSVLLAEELNMRLLLLVCLHLLQRERLSAVARAFRLIYQNFQAHARNGLMYHDCIYAYSLRSGLTYIFKIVQL